MEKEKKKKFVRHFNGKRYTAVPGTKHKRKDLAEKEAKRARKKGFLARVVKSRKKGQTFYGVYGAAK